MSHPRSFPTSAAMATLLALAVALGCSVQVDKAPSNSQQTSTAAGENSGWRVIGPGGGGTMYEPTINPHDPDHVFVRCDMTGAYVTGARSTFAPWSATTSSIPTIPTRSTRSTREKTRMQSAVVASNENVSY